MSGGDEEDREKNLGLGILMVLGISFLGWYLVYLGIEAMVQIVTGGR